MSIAVGPYTTRAECDAKLPEALQEALDHYVNMSLGDQAVDDIRLPADYLREQLVKAQWEETRQLSVGPMTWLHVLLQFDRKIKDRILEEHRQAIIGRRLHVAATWSAIALALLTVAFGYLKIDLATGGVYRGRLRLAAAAAILGLVAVAVAVCRWDRGQGLGVGRGQGLGIGGERARYSATPDLSSLIPRSHVRASASRHAVDPPHPRRRWRGVERVDRPVRGPAVGLRREPHPQPDGGRGPGAGDFHRVLDESAELRPTAAAGRILVLDCRPQTDRLSAARRAAAHVAAGDGPERHERLGAGRQPPGRPAASPAAASGAASKRPRW